MKKTYAKPEITKAGILSEIAAASPSNIAVSDIRLKTDVNQVGMAANGLPIYTFKYIGGEGLYQGVMAQDVLKVHPEAVAVLESGFLAVRYDMLGMEMIRLH